jgi:hypothetical protein
VPLVEDGMALSQAEETAFRLISDRSAIISSPTADAQNKAMARASREVASLVTSLSPGETANLIETLVMIGTLGVVEIATREAAPHTAVLDQWKREYGSTA